MFERDIDRAARRIQNAIRQRIGGRAVKIGAVLFVLGGAATQLWTPLSELYQNWDWLWSYRTYRAVEIITARGESDIFAEYQNLGDPRRLDVARTVHVHMTQKIVVDSEACKISITQTNNVTVEHLFLATPGPSRKFELASTVRNIKIPLGGIEYIEIAPGFRPDPPLDEQETLVTPNIYRIQLSMKNKAVEERMYGMRALEKWSEKTPYISYFPFTNFNITSSRDPQDFFDSIAYLDKICGSKEEPAIRL